eukprot:7166586-Lingulodinium_polyedra.AAC.1
MLTNRRARRRDLAKIRTLTRMTKTLAGLAFLTARRRNLPRAKPTPKSLACRTCENGKPVASKTQTKPAHICGTLAETWAWERNGNPPLTTLGHIGQIPDARLGRNPHTATHIVHSRPAFMRTTPVELGRTR